MSIPKRIRVKFYRLERGGEPVREWLLSLPKEDRAVIGEDIRTVEFGWPIGMPTCRHVTGGIREVRSHLARGRIARVLFCISHQEMHLLHGFIKKTEKTPTNDIDIARQRKKNLEKHDHGKST